MHDHIKWWVGGAMAASLLGGLIYSASARAADMGGACCADLEERVAELEATVARKGNRKVRLTISGEVSKAVLWHDIDGLAGTDKLRVIDNANAPTRIRFDGDARAGKDTFIGFTVEIGLDETKGTGLGLAVDDFTIRRSAVWLKSPLGKVTLGRESTATDGIVEIDVSNANVASLPMSLEPIWTYSGLGSILGGILNPVAIDGARANIVRYDSPAMAGFVATVAWGGGQTASGDDVWDAALRWSGEDHGFKFAAGAGYRVEKLSGLLGPNEMKTLGGSASAMHATTGLFVTGAFGRQQDHPIFRDLRMWQVRGGIENRFIDIGRTTLFAEYGDHRLSDWDINSTFWGFGVVQSIDAAAADVFLSYRSYDIGGSDAQTVFGGMRVRW